VFIDGPIAALLGELPRAAIILTATGQAAGHQRHCE